MSNTLESMPSWAQEIVVDQALGLLEHDCTWEWTALGEVLGITVHTNSSSYILNKATGKIY